MSKKEKEDFLLKNGWSKYYNDDYWVNPKTVEKPSVQDYTNYGFNLNDAFQYEKKNLPKFKYCVMIEISRSLWFSENGDKL